jgi:hypothetical protein
VSGTRARKSIRCAGVPGNMRPVLWLLCQAVDQASPALADWLTRDPHVMGTDAHHDRYGNEVAYDRQALEVPTGSIYKNHLHMEHSCCFSDHRAAENEPCVILDSWEQ